MDEHFILLPVEIQSRELDAKLLLACFLAKENMHVVIGSRQKMHDEIASLPKGVYLAKDFRKPSIRIFRILRDRGCPIVAWDEEGVIFYNREIYHRRRVNAKALGFVEQLYAWNEENAELLRTAPGYGGAPVHVTGNQRIDLLRPELRDLFAEDKKLLQQRFGKFILINTNFGRINPGISLGAQKHNPDKNIQDPKQKELTDNINKFKKKIFSSFMEMVPELARAFPDTNIVIRPHPSEKVETWVQITQGFQNVKVVHEGHVYPWLMAAEATIHNGCTTGVEAFLLGRPVISYRPVVSEEHEIALPNKLSHHAGDMDELIQLLSNALEANGGLQYSDEQYSAAKQVFPNIDGDFAAFSIASKLKSFIETERPPRKTGWRKAVHADMRARLRKWEKKVLSLIPNHKTGSKYCRQRFPGVSHEYMTQRLEQIKTLTGDFEEVSISPLMNNIYYVHPRKKS